MKKEILGLILVELISIGIMVGSALCFLALKSEGNELIDVLPVFWLKVVFALIFFFFLGLTVFLPKNWFKH